MTIPQLGTIQEVELREIWQHEALSFTPWLAANIHLLSDLIQVPLEVEGTEVSVGPYFADILARETHTDRLVLIENQIEPTDHSHLGQILTYLSGLEVKVVIWIAKEFREPHISAMRWLNDETDESFAFFAIKIGAVRIGDSVPAPQFEIICRPNFWEKHLHTVAKNETSEIGKLRLEFWTNHVLRHPIEETRGPANAAHTRWRTLDDIDLVISSYLASKEVGVFIRGKRNADPVEIHSRLETKKDLLQREFECELRPHAEGRFLVSRFPTDLTNKDDWSQVSDWLIATGDRYESVLRDAFQKTDSQKTSGETV